MFKNSILVLILLILTSCNVDNWFSPNEELNPELEISSGAPGTIVSITNLEGLEDDSFSGYIDDVTLEMRQLNSSLCFVVPDLTPGSYLINLEINNKNYDLDFNVLDKIVVENPVDYINEFQEQVNIEFALGFELKDSLVKSGILDSGKIYSDSVFWSVLNKRSVDELSKMTADQKQQLADILAANSSWINEISNLLPVSSNSLKSTSVSGCEDLRHEGLRANANKELFRAIKIAIDYKWCQARQFVDAKTDNLISKSILLWENTEHPWATVTLANLIGRKIDALGNRIANIGNDEFVADDMDSWEEWKSQKLNTLVWYNGERKKIFTKIKFRTPLRSDMNTSGTLGEFATAFDNFITAYDQYANSISKELVWRPEFRTRTKILDFNRNLFIPTDKISNDKVVLVNTQVVDDNWEVIFATDEEEDQSFTFDLVYDDGEVQLSTTLNAKVGNNTPPDAILSVDPISGYTSTIFTFDAGESFDAQNSNVQLKARWDWNNDSIWDTGYSSSLSVKHQFSEAGNYEISVEIVDEEGLVSTDKVEISVTDVFVDSRDGNQYGYKVYGDQTWMIENLAYLPSVNTPLKDSLWEKHYYVYDYLGNNVDEAKSTQNYQTYGVMYNIAAVKDACPSGWHTPTTDEWEKLIKYLGENGYNYNESQYSVAKSMASTSGWIKPSNGTYFQPGSIGYQPEFNNSSGFNILPGGFYNTRFEPFVFDGLGTSAIYITSFYDIDEYEYPILWTVTNMYNRRIKIEFHISRMGSLIYSKIPRENDAGYIRCVKD
ncbi:FISUMP domain-containing protein [Saccharicrinis sp. FJH62]|uniref:FISUMP domain-containing protein n=1 Tax=Saccharicrinis sp. FJH62 TaxID=3344657 RepID=UPI0035D44BC4